MPTLLPTGQVGPTLFKVFGHHIHIKGNLCTKNFAYIRNIIRVTTSIP